LEPDQPGPGISRLKDLRKLPLLVQLIAALILGPEQDVKRGSGHTSALLFLAFFPTASAFLPTGVSIAEREPTGKAPAGFPSLSVLAFSKTGSTTGTFSMRQADERSAT
jgi:hypothetical protein